MAGSTQQTVGCGAASPDLPQPHDIKREMHLAQPEAALHGAAKDLLQQLIPAWSEFNKQDISVSKISGGITNLLLKLSPPVGSEQSAVAFRVFGDKTEDLIDRQRELRVLRVLNASGFGAPVVGTFVNGRVEIFIPYHPLRDAQLSQPRIASAVAARLAQLHAVQIDEPRIGEVFNLLHRWLRDAGELRMKTEDARRRFQTFDLAEMDREVSEVQEACEALESPIVCSHNDLLAGNILVPDQEGAVDADGKPQRAMQFIDFEYSCHMYRGFDWGNHFNEYAGFDCDYSQYPDRRQAEHFLHSYLAESYQRDPTEEEVRAAVVEADTFSLASHQFWGTWSLFQAAYSAIDFDYLAYANLRWSEYRRQKESRLAAAVQMVAGRRSGRPP